MGSCEVIDVAEKFSNLQKAWFDRDSYNSDGNQNLRSRDLTRGTANFNWLWYQQNCGKVINYY